LNIINHIGGLPGSVFDVFCGRFECSSIANADIAVSAMRVMRGEARANDDDRLIVAATQPTGTRSGLAMAFLSILRYRSRLELPKEIEDRLEEPAYISEALSVLTTADSASDLADVEALLTAAVDQEGAEELAYELARSLSIPDATGTSTSGQVDLVLPIFDRAVDRSLVAASPRIAYSRALLALMCDHLDPDAEATLLGFVDDPDYDLSRGAARQLLEAYYGRRDYDTVYAFLDRLRSPVAANTPHWTRPLDPRQRSWLLERAKQGDREAAVLVCRLSDDRDADSEAFTILERTVALASPGEVSGLADFLCSEFYDDGCGEAGTEARRLGLELLRKCCPYLPRGFTPFGPSTTLIQLLADGHDGADEMTELLADAIQSGDPSGVNEVRRFQDTLGKDRTQWLLDQWKTLTDAALLSVWEWARKLPWPDERQAAQN
jgi:hypothetical protein